MDDLAALDYLEEICFGADRFSRERLKYIVAKANASFFVAVMEREIVGSAIMLWRKKSTIGRLYSIAVAPEFHGRNLGSKLLEKCEKAARKRRCRIVILEVRADNKPAIALYRKFGYLYDSVLPAYYADGTNGLRMIKRLEPR
jgi:ribosomal protein S18 acetylase RimI-like enzyme